MGHLGPLSYTALRFTLGAATIFPLAWMRRHAPVSAPGRPVRNMWLLGGILAGLAMFCGINLQQIGLMETTAGNAGFITGLYVVIVPILGMIWGRYPTLGVWIGAVMGAVGLYFLSVQAGFTLGPGDGWVLACAFVWAAHIWIVSWLSPQIDFCVLACGQATVCAVLSFMAAWWFGETITLAAMRDAWVSLAWGGFMSVTVGFTLQIMGQKDSPPSHAAIILQFEAVFAAISGWLILSESITSRTIVGMALIMSGMLIAQLWSLWRGPEAAA